MEAPICQVKGCEKRGLIIYGGKIICGDCMMKIINRQIKKQEQEIKELEENPDNA